MKRIPWLLSAIACAHAHTNGPADLSNDHPVVATDPTPNADLHPDPSTDRPARWIPRAAGATLEQAICVTPDGGASLDLIPDPSAASARVTGPDEVAVCRRGACHHVHMETGETTFVATNAEGDVVVTEPRDSFLELTAQGRSRRLEFKNPIDVDWSCGGAEPLDGDTIFIVGETCEEFPKKPFLWDSSLGKPIARYADLKKDDSLGVDDFRFWKLADHSWVVWEWGSEPRVVMIDDRTGHASVTVKADASGKIQLTEHGKSRMITPPACPPEDPS